MVQFVLEHFQKCCSHSGQLCKAAVFLGFGFVSAQSQGFANLLLRQSLAKPQKSSLRNGYNIFSNALARGCFFLAAFCALVVNSAPAQSVGSADLTGPLHHGAIGVGSWNTTAEFKDIVVTSNGVVLY